MRENSQKTYSLAWEKFQRWCSENGVNSIPATGETICQYLLALSDEGAQYKTVSIARTVIARNHDISNIASHANNKIVQDVMKSIFNNTNRPPKRKSPLTTANIRAIANLLPKNKRGISDKAILLTFFAGGLPSGAIESIYAEDVIWIGNTAIIKIRDYREKDRHIKILPGDDNATCPIAALRAWISFSGITSGPLFRPFEGGKILEKSFAASKVNHLVKTCVKKIGLNPKDYGGHSLRSGLALAALRNEVPISEVQLHLGVTSLEGMRPYFEIAEAGKASPSAKVDL